LHQSSIPQTNSSIAQRINPRAWIVPRLTSWLICDADDLKTISSDRIDKIGAFNLDCLDGARGIGAEREERELELPRSTSASMLENIMRIGRTIDGLLQPAHETCRGVPNVPP